MTNRSTCLMLLVSSRPFNLVRKLCLKSKSAMVKKWQAFKGNLKGISPKIRMNLNRMHDQLKHFFDAICGKYTFQSYSKTLFGVKKCRGWEMTTIQSWKNCQVDFETHSLIELNYIFKLLLILKWCTALICKISHFQLLTTASVNQ